MDKIKQIGVLGAGVMGTGVAQKYAQYGYDIVLIDVEDSILNKSIRTINRNLRIHNMTSKEKINSEEILSRIKVSTSYGDLKGVDIIIENIPEVLELKKKLYQELDCYCKEDCYFLVNTSCISITEIASFTKRPEKVIGVHFMNPVPLQKFAEVIKGYYTGESVIELVKENLKAMDIECTVVNDSPGFVSNRLSHLFMNEAANLVMEGVATPEQVDLIFTKGFHHETGPLHTADLIGLDTVMNSLEILYSSYQDPKYRCSPLLRKLVAAKLLGIKTGRGFFEYN
ncbi:MAG: 3-hydroxyacyl-CoA dehydrogenase family protein [Hungatella sp.]|jgi:3-hydroxybutyryl-CoA dehydrogenase|nr:3-hydroxyacyl-CoA dehydrogenase family protein [Hungatella sp.]